MSDRSDWLPVAQAQRPFYAGIDLGGTHIKAAIVDDQGRMLAFHTEPTHAARGPEQAAQRMGQAVHLLTDMVGIHANDIARVGLGTPGPLDLKAGVILKAGNLPGWDHFPIRDRVAAHCGHAITYANDGNAAAYGEFWVGSARSFSSLVLLTLGTGVGGGIIIGNVSVEGAHSNGSECGHIIVDSAETARLCPCGKRGHLEAYASATALILRASETLALGNISGGQSPTGPLAEAIAAGEAMTPILVARAAEAGDNVALLLVLETARWLGIGIVTLMHTIDPAAVVLGGAMTFGGEASPIGSAFIERIRTEVRSRALPILAASTVLCFASLGGLAGCIGAAGLARLEQKMAV
ncbi:MAG: ROK family protein [Planctomycetia bacterium]|nr:ROK family protein [Planctomycetia bacterium]